MIPRSVRGLSSRWYPGLAGARGPAMRYMVEANRESVASCSAGTTIACRQPPFRASQAALACR
jgi:hypothetical protein